jgi:hypothetical protein
MRYLRREIHAGRKRRQTSSVVHRETMVNPEMETGLINQMNETSNVQCEPTVAVQRSVGILDLLRVKWQNWKVRKTGRAYRHLCKAMQNDPGYALSWQCNIACVIFDSNVCNQKQANEIADKLMAHLFNVRKKTNEKINNQNQ